MKINCVNFKGNELKKVINISRKCGLSGQGVQILLNEIKRVCPNKTDKTFFYFRKYYNLFAETGKPTSTIRSGVKVVKDGKVMELNIDPRKFQPRDLLQEMVQGIKKLVSGVAKSDIKPIFYDTSKPKNWTSFYNDELKPTYKWFKDYQDSFKK